MERNYSNSDFERYVKENADQYRMFPSEKVWKGVHNALHTRRRWSGVGLAFLLLLTGSVVTWVMTIYPASSRKQDIGAVKNDAVKSPAEHPATPTASREISDILPFSKQSLVKDAPAVSTGRNGAESITNVLSEERTSDMLPIVPQQHTFARTGPDQTVAVLNLGKPEAVLSEPAITSSITTEDRSGITGNPERSMQQAPLTIESVINSYQFKVPPKRVSWQFFITPTVSYRKLSVNKSFDNAPGSYPFASPLPDVNQAVTHKPDIGLQLGFSARYPLSKAVKLRAGLQFNINRYDIKALSYNGELATINLNGGANSSVSAWTRYRNYNGYNSNWLKNFYFSISAPFGAEVNLFGNSHTSFGVAGTLQPTYIISDKAYLISTDYKNYAKVPGLIRHVNVSTGFETFVNYSTGKTRWQVGPQVRYQMLSSFKNKYPVKENLFDFGLKVGVSLNN